jgi:hypothetical protein
MEGPQVLLFTGAAQPADEPGGLEVKLSVEAELSLSDKNRVFS